MAWLRSWVVRIVGHPLFSAGVFSLILASVATLAWELTLPVGSPRQRQLAEVQSWFTLLFCLELALRWLASRDTRRFLRESWVDLLAVLPLLRVFRLGRAFSLLRLLRLLRLPNLADRHLRSLHVLVQGRGGEGLLYGSLALFVVVAGSLTLELFEGRAAGGSELEEYFWRALFSLVAGEYTTEHPTSRAGKLAALGIMGSGLAIFAALTGTVSAVMVEKMREGAWLGRMRSEDMEEHLLVCGWNSGAITLLAEVQRCPAFARVPILLISDREARPELGALPAPERVWFLHEDFTRAEVLTRAGVERARAAVILSDTYHGRSRQDADARTVLAALTIEKLNPKVHTCAELSNAANEFHLRMGKVDQVVVTQELAGHLLAQGLFNPGATEVLKDLVQHTSGARLVELPVPRDWSGRRFEEALGAARERFGVIPLGASRGAGPAHMNPHGWILEEGDRLLCLATPPADLPAS